MKTRSMTNLRKKSKNVKIMLKSIFTKTISLSGILKPINYINFLHFFNIKSKKKLDSMNLAFNKVHTNYRVNNNSLYLVSGQSSSSTNNSNLSQ